MSLIKHRPNHVVESHVNAILKFIPIDYPFTIREIDFDRWTFKFAKSGEPNKASQITEGLAKGTLYEQMKRFFLLNDLAVDNKYGDGLELTRSGKILCSFRSISSLAAEEYRVVNKLVVESIIPKLLDDAPPYGEFACENFDFRGIVAEFNEPDRKEGEPDNEYFARLDIEYAKYNMIWTQEFYRQNVADNESLDFLVSEGFVINRNDKDEKGFNYRQFTDKGRELRECGSIVNYYKKQSDIAKKLDEEKQLQLIHTQNQIDLTKNQIDTNENVKLTNKNIIDTNWYMKRILVATIAAALLAAYPDWHSLMFKPNETKELEKRINTLKLSQQSELMQLQEMGHEINALSQKLDSALKTPQK